MQRTEFLQVPYLDLFWQRQMSILAGEAAESDEADWMRDNVLKNGLGVPIEGSADFLATRPTRDDFHRWVLRINGGAIEPWRVERVNAAIAGEPYGQLIQSRLEEVNTIEDVLTAADLAFWEEHGYVIVREAIPLDQAQASEQAVWEHLGMSRGNPSTWYDRPIGKGIMTDVYRHPVLDANRDSLRIRKAFAQLWQTVDLWTTIDRAGFNPPENGRFSFPGPLLHWDMNLTPPFDFGTQGILYLCDTAEEQGAFTCIPGFHRTIESWLEGLPSGTDPGTEILRHSSRPIAACAGDLIIWHEALPHGSSPNRGDYPRIVQYLNMYPMELKDSKVWR